MKHDLICYTFIRWAELSRSDDTLTFGVSVEC